jgi:hypothetical protein
LRRTRGLSIGNGSGDGTGYFSTSQNVVAVAVAGVSLFGHGHGHGRGHEDGYVHDHPSLLQLFGASVVERRSLPRFATLLSRDWRRTGGLVIVGSQAAAHARHLSFGTGPLTLAGVPSPKFERLTLCLLALSLAGCQRGNSARAPAPAALQSQIHQGSPTIDFDSRVHDFGTVNEGAVLKHVFTVKNTGTSPLEVRNVVTSCGCTGASLAVGALAPGRSEPLAVTFDTHGFRGVGSKTISVDSDDPQHPTSTLEIMYKLERLLALERTFVRLQTKRGTPTSERVWMEGKLIEQAKPRVAKLEGNDPQVQVKTIEARRDGKIKKGLEIKLRGDKLVSRYGDVTIATGLSDPAELVLRFNVIVD